MSADDRIWGNHTGLDYRSGCISAGHLTEGNTPHQVQLQLLGEAMAAAEPDTRVINALVAWTRQGQERG